MSSSEPWGQIVPGMVVTAYKIDSMARVEACTQRNGDVLWAVRDHVDGCMSREGYFEPEPQPSSRDAEFLQRCRFTSAKEAFEAYRASQEMVKSWG